MDAPVRLGEIASVIGKTKRTVERMAINGAWKFIEVDSKSRHKRRLYALNELPKEIRNAVRNARLSAICSNKSENLNLLQEPIQNDAPITNCLVTEHDITDWQRHHRDARYGVCQAVNTLIQNGLKRSEAIITVIGIAIKEGENSHEYKQLILARDVRGIKHFKSNHNLPGVRSIERWLGAEDLTPKKRQKDLLIPDWAADFLACYQQPQKPSVERAYQEFCNHASDRPSIHQVRRFLDKLPAITREKGRMGPRELKNIKPFVRRSFEDLWPNDVWSADGHTFDAEVQHPLHGRPFRPEITSIIDISTRAIVGFSVGLAESSLATVDALRYAITQYGVPALFYVDNGSGYANDLLENAATGLLSRLGITVKHSLPYNSQARGVIERLHRSVWVPAAKTLPSYMGADMDREAKQQNFKMTRTGDKDGVMRLSLSWTGFIKLCEDTISEYNQRAHSSLPKYLNEDGKRVHFSPAGFWAHKAATLDGYEAVTIDDEVAETLFRPRVERKVIRAEISLFGNRYFSSTLASWHGESVHVGYDIHDPQHIWIYSLAGEFIGKADFNGNAKDYFPKSVLEQGREKRADGRLRRLEVAADEIRAERDGAPALDVLPAEELPGMRTIAIARKLEEKQPVEVAATIPQEDRERYLFWRDLDTKAQTGQQIPDSLRPFYRGFPNTAVWRSWNSFYNETPAVEERVHY